MGQKWARYGLRKRMRVADLFVMDRYCAERCARLSVGRMARTRTPLSCAGPHTPPAHAPAWGLLEPSRRGGENAQKTRNNGGKMGEIRPKRCEGRELTKDQLAAAGAGQARAWAPRAGRIGSDGYRRAVPTRGESDGGFRLPAVVCRRTNNELFAVRALAQPG